MTVKIVYEDIAVGAKESFEPEATQVTAYSEPELLKQERELENYGNPCELYSVLLDGSSTLIPDDLSGEFAFVSNSLSGWDGSFEAPPVLTLTASGQYSSQGITLVFDQKANRFATAVNIKWYREAALLSEMDFRPDAPEYFCANKVENYTRLVITFAAMNMPENRLTLNEIRYGITRRFLRSEIEHFTMTQEIDPVSAAISINTMDFSLKKASDIEYVFQEKQPVRTYFDDELVSSTFVTGYNRNSDRSYSISTEDAISILEDSPFMGGMYRSKPITELLDELFGPLNVPYELDESLASVTLTGYLKVGSCREALRQIAFAALAAVDTSYSEAVRIFPLREETAAELDRANTFEGQSTRFRDKLTELHLTSYSYVETDRSYTAYQAADSGTGMRIRVTFPEPLHSLSITNGSISDSGANFAVIDAFDGCILTGKRYDKTQAVTVIRNPLILAGDKENVKEMTGYTLVNGQNAQEIAQRCFDYYSGRREINEKILAGSLRPGDKVSQNYDYMEPVSGRIVSMKFTVYGSLKAAEVIIR